MRTLAERERRLERARIASRIEIAIGALAVAMPIAFYLFAPSTLGGPMFRVEPSWGLALLPIAGYIGVVAGFLWLLRIRFRGPEDGARSNWRSH